MVSTQAPPFWDAPGWDDALESTPEAKRRILVAAASLALWMREYAKNRSLTVEMIVKWHGLLFEGVFPQFAGKVRGPDAHTQFPFENRFGRHLGVGYAKVPEALAGYADYIVSILDQLDGYPRTAEQELASQAIRGAAWLHADFVRIHPFLNGNGRTGRLIIDYMAYRYDLEPIGLQRPSAQAYVSAMTDYMARNGIEPLVRFLTPLMMPPHLC